MRKNILKTLVSGLVILSIMSPVKTMAIATTCVTYCDYGVALQSKVGETVTVPYEFEVKLDSIQDITNDFPKYQSKEMRDYYGVDRVIKVDYTWTNLRPNGGVNTLDIAEEFSYVGDRLSDTVVRRYYYNNRIDEVTGYLKYLDRFVDYNETKSVTQVFVIPKKEDCTIYNRLFLRFTDRHHYDALYEIDLETLQ